MAKLKTEANILHSSNDPPFLVQYDTAIGWLAGWQRTVVRLKPGVVVVQFRAEV